MFFVSAYINSKSRANSYLKTNPPDFRRMTENFSAEKPDRVFARNRGGGKTRGRAVVGAHGKREQVDVADQRIRFARQGQKRIVPRCCSVRSIGGRVEKQAVLRRQPAGDAGFAVRRFGDGVAAHAKHD